MNNTPDESLAELIHAVMRDPFRVYYLRPDGTCPNPQVEAARQNILTMMIRPDDHNMPAATANVSCAEDAGQ